MGDRALKQSQASSEENKQLLLVLSDAVSGDDKALKQLIELVHPRILKFLIFLCHNDSLAHDLCQETMIKMLNHLKTLRDPQKFYPWLFQCAKNLYFDHLKSAKNRENVDLEDIDDGLLVAPEGAQNELLTFRKLLSQIETDYQVVILLIDVEGYSYEEAGQILSLSEDAVRSRLHRARQALEKKIQDSETK